MQWVRLKATKTRKSKAKPPALPLIHLVLFSYCPVPRPFLSPNAQEHQDKENSLV